MNTLSTIIEPLGWAIMHFLWQGTAIALALRMFLWLTRRRSPQVRYAAAGAAMLLMLGSAAGTVWWQVQAVHTETAAAAPANGTNMAYTPHLPYEPLTMGEAAADPLPTAVLVESQTSAALPSSPVVPVSAETPTTADRLRPFLPWLVGVWAAGVLVFSLRLLNGWRVVRRWRAAASSIIPGDWPQRFSVLCERLGITCSVRLLSSATLAVPVVIGWIKPVVLVPASLFAGVPTAQLEALLAHELAHVRRHDYLVNLLQSALETLFFYHPAVWWVSGQLRKEREHCCDDTATALAGGVLDYARALTTLEEMRSLPAGLSLSAAGGSLLQRIRRLAGASEPRPTGLAWPLGLITLAAVAAVLPFTLLHAAPDGSSPAEKPGAVGAADEKDSGNPAGVPAVLTDELERLLKVTSDMTKFETELDISVPAADPAEAKNDKRPSELVINVQEDGNVVFSGNTLTAEQLAVKLAEIAGLDKKRPIIIRGTEATSYNKIVAVLAATHKAGLHHVSFATTTTPEGAKKSAPEKEAKLPEPAAPKALPVEEMPASDPPLPGGNQKAPAQKLLEEGATMASDGLPTEARAKLSEIGKLLGKPGDHGFQDEYQLLLADAEMVMGRLDRLEAERQNTETPDARRTAAKLRESALRHFTDAVVMLLAYDSYDKKSVPCRSRMADAYFEMGGVLSRLDNGRDASVAYSEAATVYTELREEAPENAAHALGLARIYDAIAVLNRALEPGDDGKRKALEYQQHSAMMLRPFLEVKPRNISVVLQLAKSLSLNGDLHRELGDTAAADAAHKEATALMASLSDAEKISGALDEKRRQFMLSPPAPERKRRIIIPRPAQDDTAGERQPGNYSRIFQHKDGTRTESLRKNGTLRESTYDRNGERVGARVFIFDKDGQPRQAVTYDGKMIPLGTIQFGYDPRTGALVEERHFNAKAKLVRRVFYHGALKQPEYAGKFVAFTYDPENPRAKPVLESGDVKPALPVSDWKEAKTLNFRRSKFEEGDGEIRELTYDRDDQLLSVSVAYLDGLGRHRLAVICDGKMNPEESILYSYHGATRQLKAERHFDRNGKLIREASEAELKEENGRSHYIGEVSPFSSGLSSPPVKTDAGPRNVANAAEAQRLTALGKGFFDAKQFEKAQESYEAAVIMDPANAEVRRMWLLSEAMLARQSNPFSVPTHPDVRKEALSTSISLTVKDVDGGKAIPAFRVIAGVRSQAGNKDIVNLQPHTLQEGRNGAMFWPLDKAYDEMALRVEADGFMPQVFNWIEKKQGPRELVFKMVEDKGTQAKILTPDGQPASGATAAVAMVQRDAVIEGGGLRHDGEAIPEKAADRWRWPRLIQVDAGGGFMLPAEDDPTAAVLVVHLSGVREMSFAEFKKSPVVTLQPWARIEGRVQWGDKPGAGAAVSLTIHRDSYGYPGVVAQYEKTTAGADGSFVFEKVLHGHVQLSCPIEVEPGNKSGITQINMTGRIAHLVLKPGTNQALIGGAGRVVKGKLTGRDSWEGVTFHFHPTAPHIGFSGDDEMWKAWGEFQKSPSGPLFFRDGLKVKADGTIEITGVLPGEYQIFFSREAGKIQVASGKFDVGAEVPGQKAEPVDAGEFVAK